MLVTSVGTLFHTGATVDESLVTAAEHVAVALEHAFLGAYLATTDVYVGGAEDIAFRTAVHIILLILILEEAFTIPVVVATATTEDVAHHMATPQIDMGFTTLVDGGWLTAFKAIIMLFILTVLREGVGMHGTAAYGADLSTAIEAAAHDAVPHGDMGTVDIAVGHITATEDIAAQLQFIVASRHVVQLWNIFIFGGGIFRSRVLITVAYIALVHRDVGIAEDGAALTSAIDITGDGGDAADMAGAVGIANDHMGLAKLVAHIVCHYPDGTFMVAHAAAPASAIDIAHGAALNVGIGTGSEALGIVRGIVCADTEQVVDGSRRTGRIDILVDGAA